MRMSIISARHIFKRFARQAIGCPVAHLHSAQRQIEIDARLIPVQTAPFQPAAAALHGDVRKFLQRRLAVTPAAMLRQDEQILQIQSGTAKEG